MTSLVEVLAEGRDLGFLGPGPIDEHVDHARAFALAASRPPARALDLGAGGGLPGLVLAYEAWPQTTWTFLDSQLRRTTFLREAVRSLGLEGRVTVVRERAEVAGRDPDHRQRYDVVAARSFGPPSVTAECAAPLLRPGGCLLVSEPPDTTGTERWPTSGLAELGLGPATVHGGDGTARIVRMELDGDLPSRYPRRVGIPSKRPLF